MRVSRRFLAALVAAIGVVLQEPKSPESWATAVGIVAAAASNGAKRDETGRAQ